MSLLPGWRPALRLAWRDVRRSRGRALLVLFMIALPVLAVTAADVVYATSSVSPREGLDRRLGAADARLQVTRGVSRVVQWVDPDSGSARLDAGSAGASGMTTLSQVRAALGRDVTAVEEATGSVRLATPRGALSVSATETDLTDPLTRGLFRLESGRWPTDASQVVVNAAVADHGDGIGSTVQVDGTTRTVVGIVESASQRSGPVIAGPLGSLGIERGRVNVRTWLIGGGDVTWSQVRALNGIGVAVLSREVVEHPPSESLLPPQIRGQLDSRRASTYTVIALVVAMALLEVVLLAGPAFAVGARRQARTLALMAASGGTPKQSRRVILASGLVLGAIASVVGTVAGIGVAWLVLPRVQRLSTTWFGPFDVNWLHLLGVAAFGLLSALLAAVVPAWIASRQNVVAVLAGRRGDRAPNLRSPVLGALLLGAGIAGSVAGARKSFGGEYLIALSAIVSVIGMVFVVPIVVLAMARVCGRLPLVGRYAVRDAARHRTRTVPAIAAVAATVAGVVTLGIADSSNAAQNQANYTPSAQTGTGVLVVYHPGVHWSPYVAMVQQNLPGAVVSEVRGLDSRHERHRLSDGTPGPLLTSLYPALVEDILVSRGPIPGTVIGLSKTDRTAASAMLERGGAVVFTSRPVTAKTVVLRRRVPGKGPGTGPRPPLRLPALYLVPENGTATASAIVSASAARRAGLPTATLGLTVAGPISSGQEQDVSEALGGLTRNGSFHVERGYQEPASTRILLLILGVMGGVLMLGGTLTATFLALSDARPDLATLSAVGASPRTRRGVAAAYALVVGGAGALLGAAVGFIPGIAITYPLTGGLGVGGATPSHYLDVPWVLILTLVVALPLLTALIVGLAARSRLPLVARLD